MKKTYKIEQRSSREAKKSGHNTNSSFFISYYNTEWNDISEKCICVNSPEHYKKFIELLEEAGYMEKR